MVKSGAGERIGGYRVVRRLATGGTSDVLLAKAEGPHGFERTVVLKILLAQFQDDPEAMAMFAREASAYARLSHASIVQLYDFFALDGQLVMVLEYVDGPALHRLRGMLRTVGQHVEDRAALYLAQRVFSALAAAHAARDEAGKLAPVIHRDVNPSNVLLPWDGQVKLADFGVAKVSGVASTSRVGVLKGTYGYMAPEQITGVPVTPATDVYAGAIVLWELLTRRRAFQRGALPEVEALRQMSEPRIPALDTLRPDLPKGLRDFVRRALTPDVRKRDVSAEEAVSVLRSLVSSEEGRDSLAASLAAVRHEPRPAFPSAPPQEDETQRVPPANAGTPAVPRVGPPAIAPPPAPSPRPLAATTRGVGPGLPPAKAPTLAKPSSGSGVVTSAPALANASPPARTFADPAPPAAAGRTPPPPRPGPRKASVPPPDEVVKSPLSGPPGSGAHALAAAMPPPESAAKAPGRSLPPTSMFLGTPSVPVSLQDAIDEILRDVPSDIPPEIFNVPGSPATEGPERAAADPRVGAIPPAPAPLVTARSPSQPLSFPSLDQTLAMEREARLRARANAAAPSPAAPLVNAPAAPAAAPPPEPAPPAAPSEPPVATLPFPPVGHAAMAPPMADPSSAPSRAPAALPSVIVAPSAPPMAYVPSAPPPANHTPTVPPMRADAAATTSSTAVASPTVRPRRRGTRWVAVVAVLAVVGAAGAAGWHERGRIAARVTALRQSSAPPPRATSAPVPASSAPVPASTSPAATPSASPAATPFASASPSARASATASPSASPPASATASPPPSVPGATTGQIKTAGSTPHRRIFVDGTTAGQTPDTVTVKCGVHTVKIGSSGKPQRLDVPCGGELTLTDR